MRCTPLADRFWPRVEKTSSCWLWTGPLHMGHGNCKYGHMWVGRYGPDGIKFKRVTHVVWFLTHGRWPKQLNHKCHNCACVNPSHLYEGTQRDNINDRTAKWGTKGVWRAKLTEKQVRVIRYALRYGVTQAFLSKTFSLTSAAIHKIAKRKSWKHVEIKGLVSRAVE